MPTTIATGRPTFAPAASWMPSAAVIEQTIAAAIGHLNARRPADAIASLRGLKAAVHVSHATADLIGRVLVSAGDPEAALGWFDTALRKAKGFADGWIHRADALAKLGRLDEAARSYEAGVSAGARDPAAHYHHGLVLSRLNQHGEALAAFDKALKLQPAYPEAWRAAGAALRALGDGPNALGFFDQALTLRPDSLDAILDKANLLHGLGRLTEALATYEAGLALLPAIAQLWNNRAMVLHDLGRMDEARASVETALDLDPALAQAHLNCGTILFRLGLFAAAVDACDAAVSLRPSDAEALSCRGLALKMLGRFEDAEASFEAALVQDPRSIHARANRGELQLLLGRFEQGWPDYEFRFFTERQVKPALNRPVPEWTGQHRPGERIVVFADQGNGDTLQFARFLPALAAQEADVTFVCPPRLQRILRPITGAVRVRDAVDDEDPFDYQIALSSMPGAFRTNLATLESARPYLQAEPERVRHWAAALGNQGFKIGLCWRGAQHWQCDPKRSLALSDLEPLGGLPGLRMISLQMPDNSEAVPDGLAIECLDVALDSGPDAFVDTAAVMAGLDLVVTCDTSIAHLAGALGCPTWVLLRAVPEWRWMLGRSTSPWYPDMRLFRQERLDDWSTPVRALAAAIMARMGTQQTA